MCTLRAGVLCLLSIEISVAGAFGDSIEMNLDEWMEQCASFEYTGVNPFRHYTPGGGDYLNGDGILVSLPPADNNSNGMFDSDELALLSAVLTTPSASCHEAVHSAYSANFLQLQNDLGSMASFLPSLKYVMAAYATIGDGAYTRNPIHFEGSWGVLAEQIYGLQREDSRWEQGAPVSSQYDRQSVFLAFSGDCDGDGVSNKDEYDALAGVGGPNSQKRQQFLRNALLDSAAFRFTQIPRGGLFSEGEPLELNVEVAGAYGMIEYQWIKDGNELEGQTDSLYSIDSLTLDDSGSYSCRVSDEAKAIYETQAVVVQVAAKGQLPVSSVWCIATLLLSSVLAGALAIRRRHA